MAGKQAKRLSPKEINLVLAYIKTKPSPLRLEVIFLLSIKAGLRAKEISQLKWGMVTDASNEISDYIRLTDEASKGKSGREIPLNSQLKATLIKFYLHNKCPSSDTYIIKSSRGPCMTRQGMSELLGDIYKEVHLDGCSSHSGRRTWGTLMARNCYMAGGSLVDVKELLGHANLNTTQTYIDSNPEAKRKLVEMI